MKLSETQQVAIAKLKNDFKILKVEKKNELKNQLNSSKTYKFEKSIIKDDFKITMQKAKMDLKHHIIHIKKPEFFKKDLAQREVEKQILNLQTSYYHGLNKCERQVRKAKKFAKHDKTLKDERKVKIEAAKIALNLYKNTAKNNLKNETEKIKLNQQVNKLREFKNTGKVVGNRVMEKVIPAANKFANEKHVLALRNGFMATIPLTIMGAFVMIIGTIPVGINIDKNGMQTLYTFMAWITDQNPQLGEGLAIMQTLSIGITALGISFAAGLDLGVNYGESPLVSGIMGLFGFLIWITPLDGGLPLKNLGGQGIFGALITSMLMVELYRIFKKYKITFRLPKQVPPAIANSFIAFIPCLLYVIVVWGIKYGAGFDLLNVFANLSGDMTESIMHNIGWACLIAIIPSLFWWLGIHGGTFLFPFAAAFTIALQENQLWALNGMQGGMAPYEFTENFFNIFCWMGGGGCLIGLGLSGLFFSKSKQNKAISRAAIVPAIFNISEPIMFGFPVVLNIYFLIPFILAPLGTVLIAAPLMQLFQVSFIGPIQQLPSFICGLILTGNNWKGMMIAFIIMGWATLIYAPFFITYDRVKVKEEREQLIIEAQELGITIKELLIQQEQGRIKKKGLFTKTLGKKQKGVQNV